MTIYIPICKCQRGFVVSGTRCRACQVAAATPSDYLARLRARAKKGQ